jgi:hypothetical protein
MMRPTVVDWLAGTLENGTTAEVFNEGRFTAGSVYHIGTEAVKVTDVNPPITIVRRYWDTQKQYHYTLIGEDAQSTPITNAPFSLEGRRCYLFAYFDGEASDGLALFSSADETGETLLTTDQLIWRGVISSAPQMSPDMVMVTFSIEPITMILEQSLGDKSEKGFGIRGITHTQSDSIYAAARMTIVHTERWLTGHWESIEELTGAVQGMLDEIMLAMDGDITTWNFSASRQNTRGMRVIALTEKSPDTGLGNAMDFFTNRYGGWSTSRSTVFANMNNYYALEAWPTYGYAGENSFFGKGGECYGVLNPPQSYNPYYSYDVDSTVPDNYIYYAGNAGLYLEIGTELVIKTESEEGKYCTCKVAEAVDTTLRRFRVDSIAVSTIEGVFNDHSYRMSYRMDETTSIRASSLNAIGSVRTLVDAVKTASHGANAGNVPFVTGADIDDWDSVSIEGTSAPYRTARKYSFFSATTLREVLREECKLAGIYMCLAADGRITARPIGEPSSTVAVAINDDDIILPSEDGGAWPKLDVNSEGIVSVIDVYGGYNAVDDSTTGLPIRVRNLLSLSTHRNQGRSNLEIKPKSTRVSGAPLTPEECAKIAERIFAVLASDSETITVKVPLDRVLSSTPIKVGDTVRYTSALTPNTSTGAMGIVNRYGMVVARKANLDPGKGAEAELAIRFQIFGAASRGGYAPAMRLNFVTWSNPYWLVWMDDDFFSGASDLAFFAVGDKIRVIEFDSRTPQTQTGTIVTKGPTWFLLLLDGSAPALWTGGPLSKPFDLVFADYNQYTTANQMLYCYVAMSTMVVFANSTPFLLS